MLENYLKERLQQRDVLLMTHIVIGYPDFETAMDTVAAMVAAGVDVMELQIPFSEPIADGPVILQANQLALAGGASVERCFEFAAEANRRFDIPFLFMTYYNIMHSYGVEAFTRRMKEIGLAGAIVPDLPPEEGGDYLAAMQAADLDTVFLFSPNTSDERMSWLAGFSKGLVYCVARKGVTGAETSFSSELGDYLGRCRKATDLPLAVGFGLKDSDDVRYLRGKADIAVVGSQSLRILNERGVQAVGEFIGELVAN